MNLHFEAYARTGRSFIHELARQLGYPEDQDRAARVLRSVFKALRNRLVFEESLQFIAQLPMALKAVYVDGWRYHQGRERIKHISDFIAAVRREDRWLATHDFGSDEEAEKAVRIVFMVLRNYISEGEMEDVRDELAGELKQLLDYSEPLPGQ